MYNAIDVRVNYGLDIATLVVGFSRRRKISDGGNSPVTFHAQLTASEKLRDGDCRAGNTERY